MGATSTEGTGNGAVENSFPRIQNNIKPENVRNLSNITDLTSFSGDLLVGTLWASDLESDDQESVIWASNNTEYLGLWWGGQRDMEENYGPAVSITVGNHSLDDNLDGGDYSEDEHQVNIDVDDNNWRFHDNGIMTLPDGGDIKDFNNNNIWIKISDLKTLVSSCADFAAFKTAIAAL
jgi:hypothetical protein